MYVLNLLDWYSASYSLMITALLEVLVLMHLYGKYNSNVILNKGRRQNSLSVTTNKPQRMTNVGD